MTAETVDDITQTWAIDVHAHYGDYLVNAAEQPARAQLMSGDADTVARRARDARTAWTVVSPLLGLFPRGRASAYDGNIEARDVVGRTPGLLQWVIIDPLDPRTYDQAQDMLRQPRCVGIKIHPEEHVYHISRHADAIFAFAADRRAVVLTHSGEANSLPSDLVAAANRYPEMSLILAHIGCGHDGDPTHQIRGLLESTQGNVYADTSSASSIMPRLIEMAVREAGVERVLYGTDTPLYHSAMQRARIDYAEVSDAEKRRILYENAANLLQLDKREVGAGLAPAPSPPGRGLG